MRTGMSALRRLKSGLRTGGWHGKSFRSLANKRYAVKTIRLLLGSSEAIFNALIETGVQKACGQRATVRCTTTVRVDEFIAKACAEDFQLAIFIAPDNLLPDPVQPAGRGPLQEALRI